MKGRHAAHARARNNSAGGNAGRSLELSYLLSCLLRTTDYASISPRPPDVPQAFFPSCSKGARIHSPFLVFYSFYFVLLYPSWASRPPTRTRRYNYCDLSLHLLYSPFVIIPSVHDGYRSFCAPFPSSHTHGRLFFRSRRSFQFLSCSLSLAAAAFTFASRCTSFRPLRFVVRQIRWLARALTD